MPDPVSINFEITLYTTLHSEIGLNFVKDDRLGFLGIRVMKVALIELDM